MALLLATSDAAPVHRLLIAAAAPLLLTTSHGSLRRRRRGGVLLQQVADHYDVCGIRRGRHLSPRLLQRREHLRRMAQCVHESLSTMLRRA